MKRTPQRWACLVLLAVAGWAAVERPPMVRGQNQSNAEPGSAVKSQHVETIKWKFGGNDAGSNTYQTAPDGGFESVTELSLMGTTIKSRITGRIVDGVVTEYELVNQQGAAGIKISAKDGKARITVKDKTREVEYKPTKVLFGNLHPIFTETMIRALDPGKEGFQKIEAFMFDAAMPIKLELMKKRSRAVEVDGRKQAAEVYVMRLPGVESDLYFAAGSKFAAWDVPSQKLQAIRSGGEAFLADPTASYPELSQPTLKTSAEKGVKIKMRDGVDLVADIVRPAGEGKFPVILARTPYGRELQSQLDGEWWARRGYVHIVQDVRGRNQSDGEWVPLVHERRDGYDTIDWIARQPWSDGQVGMIGGSYLGWVQWAAAVEVHPALKCIVPQVSPPDPFFNFPIDHGVPMLWGALWWANFVKEKKVPAVPEIPQDLEKLKTLPLSKVDDEMLGRNIPFYDDWLAKGTASSFAGATFMNEMNKVKIPVLHISGWWDGDGIGTKLNWARMRALGHQNQWLIYGAWSHLFNISSRFGDVDYGPDAIAELDSIYVRWFDTWLKNKSVKWEQQPRVRVFVTGANQWRDLADWPDPRSKEVTYYLRSEGPANGQASVGELAATPPGEQEPDRYTYNPAGVQIPNELKEIKSFSQMAAGASTVVKLEPRIENLLVYKTAPLTAPLEIGGPIELDLYFSTSARDTDFFASVVDVDEQGVMRLIGLPGKIRARYLSGWDRPSLLQPGKVYKATLAHWDTAHRFEKGHRLGVLITSHMFPSYARNLNTGEPIQNATRMVTAHQTIYHDAKHPSALRFRQLGQ